jgi:transcriptional regulator with XRE-family HTH domain
MKSLTGTRLRERRLALGRRQGEVAQAAGISASYLNLIEHNRRAVAGDVLERLANALGLDPAALSGVAQGALVDDLRSAAAAVAVNPDQAHEFLARFPDWAGVLLGLAQRAAGLERAVAALNDRINHDPHLSATLHDMLSAATAVRATADILNDTAELDPAWLARFHGNLAQDSARLTMGAQALVAYLDPDQQAETALSVTPQDEVMAWLEMRGWHLSEAETGGVDAAGIAALASEAARVLARGLAEQAVQDAAAMPLQAVQAAVARHGPDPVQIAQAFGTNVIAACRRIGGLPGLSLGLVICDGAGAITFRRPLPGFALPRTGAGCTRWPLYTALGRPMQPVEVVVETTVQPPQRFVLRAFCHTRLPTSFGGVERREAAMLMLPAAMGTGAQMVVGPTCRICNVAACDVRREPSILSG